MALPDLDVPNPFGTSFSRWSLFMFEQLAQYNVPNPVDEGLWQSWATAFCSIPEILEIGLPDPRMYQDWRKWASASIPLLE